MKFVELFKIYYRNITREFLHNEMITKCVLKAINIFLSKCRPVHKNKSRGLGYILHLTRDKLHSIGHTLLHYYY